MGDVRRGAALQGECIHTEERLGRSRTTPRPYRQIQGMMEPLAHQPGDLYERTPSKSERQVTFKYHT